MTINEAISRIDELKPNTASRSDKVRWLAIIDGTVQKEIVNTHSMTKKEFETEERTDRHYTDETPGDTQLLIPYPYEDVYMYWLEAQIDYYNGETKRFSNSMQMYNAMITAFRNQHNRTHMPKGATPIYFGHKAVK